MSHPPDRESPLAFQTEQLHGDLVAGTPRTNTSLGYWEILGAAAVLSLLAVCGGCAQSDAPAPSAREDWLTGTEEQRFQLVSKHLRGFDVAMVETGYRYTELYWAGRDQNWEFAAYQVEKIRTAVANGVERRPKRAASAKVLEGALPGVEEAIRRKDTRLFAERFDVLTATCNACHDAERVSFVKVAPPEHRHSPVRFGAASAATPGSDNPQREIPIPDAGP
jgi:cytochrome c556